MEGEQEEFEFTLIIIFFGLLGIAVLTWFVVSDTTYERGFVSNQQERMEEENIPDIYSGPDDPTYLKGREPETLGLGIDPFVGEFFYDPMTKKTLYVLVKNGTCSSSCLEDWKPYIVNGTVFLWEGEELYTYKNDTGFGNFLGDGYDSGLFKIARP